MNQTIKQRWVEALRSGQYTQTTGCLKGENGHCCLGVLSELYSQDNPAAKFVPKQDGMMYNFEVDVRTTEFMDDYYAGFAYGENPDDSQYILTEDGDIPWAVAKWADLASAESDHLINMNDSEKRTFAEIADFIEREL